MFTKIGNLLFIFTISLTISIYASKEIRMSVLSTDGHPLQSAAIGVPFLLEVNFKNMNINKPLTKLPGLDSIEILNVEQAHYQTIINNVATVEKKYIYTLRSDSPTMLTIGPIIMDQIQSNIVKLEIKEGTNIPIKISDNEIQCSLEVRKKDVVIGEQVPFILNFQYRDKSIQVRSIEKPELADLEILKLSGPFASDEVHNGKPYKLIKLQGVFVPKKTGIITIPAIKIVYSMPPKKSNRQRWDSAFDFVFGPRVETKHCYSNASSLIVSQLPDYNKKIDAIGEFKSFKLKLSQEKADQNQGIILSLELNGQGDLESIKNPKLHLPKELKYYDSKNEIVDIDGGQLKRFEYVIQGLQEGTYEIVPQEFIYFDVNDRKYKTLMTETAKIIIEPVSNVNLITTLTNVQIDEEEQIVDDQIGHYKKEGDYNFLINWCFFFIITGIPLFLIFIILIIYLFKVYLTTDKAKRIHQNAFYQARKELDSAEKKKDLKAIYPIFKNALANRLFINENDVTDENIAQALENKSVSRDLINKWIEFNNQILKFNFYLQDTSKTDKMQLFTDSLKWLKYFEKTL